MRVFQTKNKISPDTILQRNSDVLYNLIDGEVVMLSMANSSYFGMNKIASRIWELLEKPVTLNAIVGILLDEFHVSREQCYNDTSEFLSNLLEKKLITFE